MKDHDESVVNVDEDNKITGLEPRLNLFSIILNRKLSYLISLLLLIFLAIFSYSCSKTVDPEQIVLAKIGDTIITVSEFKRDYEFGLPHLKKGSDKKRSYLDLMIKEKILSLEGYKLGLENSDRVRKLENDLVEELLVEELFKKEVHEKIKVTPEEVQEAIKKSTVSWKLRYWIEPSLDRAQQISLAMQQAGYSTVLKNILDNNPEIELKPKDFETSYLTWLEVPQNLLESIKDLPKGEISNPTEINGVYFIFQIVDIRRDGLTVNELQSKADRFKQILFYRKVLEEAKHYVYDFMTPKNVITKGETFKKLSNALVAWKKIDKNGRLDFVDAVKKANKNQPSLLNLKNCLQDDLVTFNNGNWTLADFLDRFDPASVKAKMNDTKQFQGDLNQQVALEVRNYFMIKEARSRDLHKLSSLKKESEIWRNKWVYQETRDLFLKKLIVNDDQIQKYFDQHRNRYKIKWNDEPTFEEFRSQAHRDAYIQKAKTILNQKIDSLITYYPIFINHAILDTITTIESQKSRWMSLQVFKRSSNRLASPSVDPAWGF